MGSRSVVIPWILIYKAEYGINQAKRTNSAKGSVRG